MNRRDASKFLVAAGCLGLAGDVLSETGKAKRADKFCDSIIVCGHLNWNTVSQPWRTATGWIEDHWAPLAEAGIRYIRTDAWPGQSFDQMNMMYAAYGTRFNILLNHRDITTDLNVLESIKNGVNPAAILSFEGLNEPNFYDDSNWPDIVINHAIAIHDRIRSHPEFDHVHINSFAINGRLISAANAMIGAGWENRAWSQYDRGSLHEYTGGGRPTTFPSESDFDKNITLNQAYANISRLSPPGTPIDITEGGWNYHGDQAPSRFWVSLGAQAKYQQRLFLEVGIRGHGRCTSYVMMDNPTDHIVRHYGWLGCPNGANPPFHRRPVYDTMRRTAALFNDPGPHFDTGSLKCEVGGRDFDARIHWDLYQKRNGTFLLPIAWDNQSWDKARACNDFGKRSIKIKFKSTIKEVYSVRPYMSSDRNLVGRNTTEVNISVPDDVLVLQITK